MSNAKSKKAQKVGKAIADKMSAADTERISNDAQSAKRFLTSFVGDDLSAKKYKDKRKSVEYFHQPSLTNPHHNIPLKELLDRHAKGMAVAVYHPHYDFDELGQGDIETLELQKLDTMERLELAQQLKYDIEQGEFALEQKKKEIEDEKSSLNIFTQVATKLKDLIDFDEKAADDDGEFD